MSFYAFFKRWLPLSQLINNKKQQTFTLKNHLGTLADDLGCIPLDTWPSCPKSVCLSKIHCILSFTRFKGAY